MKSKKKIKRPKPVYFDSAATTRQKPTQVLKAVVDFAQNVGVSHGRGAYQSAIKANELVFGTRSALSKLFHIQRMDRICLLYTSPSPRDRQKSRMPSSA